MAFQSVPNTAEIVIQYTGQGANMVNTFAAEFLAGYDLAEIVALANRIDNTVNDHWLALQTDEVSYTGTLVRGLQDINDFEGFDNDKAGPGGDVSPGSPGNVTIAIKRASGLTGRSARGRTFWIGLPVDQLDTNKNTVIQADADAIVAAVDEVRLDIIEQGWVPVIVSRFSLGVKRDEGETFEWLASSIVDREVDSQRRRLLG